MIRCSLRFLVLIGLLAANTATCACAPSTDSTRTVAGGFSWFPETPLFPRLLADGTAPGTSLSKDLQSRRIVGSIGGLERLAGFRAGPFPAQLGIGATVHGSFIKTPSVLDVVTVDFFVDLPFDIMLSERWTLRTGWGHYSAHLADDGIQALNMHSINYAKDYVPLFAAYTVPAIGGFLYGGTRFDYYTIPARGKHWVLTVGAEIGNIALFPGATLYGAVDVKLKQEAAWGSTQSYQLGVKALSFGARAVRIAYTYRAGVDDRGQFYNQRATLSTIGVYLDV